MPYHHRPVGSTKRHLVLAAALAWSGAPGQLGCHRDARPPLARAGDVIVTGGYAYPSTGGMSSAYLRFENAGTGPDTLDAIIAPDNAKVGLHETVADGLAGRMVPLARLVLAGGARWGMEPGKAHMMIQGLDPGLALGDSLRLELRFARGGTVTVVVPVVPLGEMP